MISFKIVHLLGLISGSSNQPGAAAHALYISPIRLFLSDYWPFHTTSEKFLQDYIWVTCPRPLPSLTAMSAVMVTSVLNMFLKQFLPPTVKMAAAHFSHIYVCHCLRMMLPCLSFRDRENPQYGHRPSELSRAPVGNSTPYKCVILAILGLQLSRNIASNHPELLSDYWYLIMDYLCTCRWSSPSCSDDSHRCSACHRWREDTLHSDTSHSRACFSWGQQKCDDAYM